MRCWLVVIMVVCASVGRAAADEFPVRIAVKQAVYHLIQFPARHKAQLVVNCDKPGDVDLFVLDNNGKLIASDTTPGKDCKVEFTTKDKAVDCLVKIVNPGPTDNCGLFRHNGKLLQSDQLRSVEVTAGKQHSFYHTFAAGKVVILHADSVSKGPVTLSIYNVEGIKIASDPKCRLVCFDAQAPGIYRVVLTNGSKEKVVCKFRAEAHEMKTTVSQPFTIGHQARKTFDIDFPANKLAALWVTSDKQTDVDLLVYDAAGNEVTSDIRLGKDCFVGWVPQAAGRYRVVVLNNGFGENRCVLKHNGNDREK